MKIHYLLLHLTIGLKKVTLKIKPIHLFFFSKIIGDNFYIEDLEAKNLSSIKKLITNYLNDEIKSNNDIRSFFIKEKNHGSYVR